MHPYRSHTCGELRPHHADDTVRLSGWAHRKRDHYGLTQVVLAPGPGRESVVTATGQVRLRPAEAVNPELPTGQIEVHRSGTGPAQRRRTPALCRGRGAARGRDPALPVPLSRPAPAHRSAGDSDPQHPQAHECDGIQRVLDPHPHHQVAREGVRLSGPQPPAPGAILRPAPRLRSSSSNC